MCCFYVCLAVQSISSVFIFFCFGVVRELDVENNYCRVLRLRYIRVAPLITVRVIGGDLL